MHPSWVSSFVKSRSWYQTIDFGYGIKSSGCSWCGDPAWENIRTFLPDDLTGKRVLDIGCNAGILSVRCAQMGAEVVGVDWAGWRPGWDFHEQRRFVLKVFNEKEGRSLPIRFIQAKMEDYLHSESIGRFDYVLAIASIYYSSTPTETIRDISRLSDTVIIRLRDASRIELYTNLLKSFGYKEERVIREKWWEKLGHKTDDFYLYLYRK